MNYVGQGIRNIAEAAVEGKCAASTEVFRRLEPLLEVYNDQSLELARQQIMESVWRREGHAGALVAHRDDS